MITLLTDFGTADYFVGAMKGVILSVNAEACIVDVTHENPAYDIESAAFTLFAVYSSFPPHTIHVAVVDPGVGSERRPILVESESYFFVGPDNGLFSYVYEREKAISVYHLTNEDYFRHPVSSSFHGRDIFAAVAGAVSNGINPAELGVEIKDYKRLLPLAPKVATDGAIDARIIHIDSFGNCITNLTGDYLTDEILSRGCSLKIGEFEITTFRRYFAEMTGDPGGLFGIWGSAGFLEIVAFRASAAQVLGVKRGERVVLTNR